MHPSVSKLLSTFETLRFTAQLLLSRLREDRLGQTAGSLTFTTALSIVPLLAVALSIFSAFPAFAKLQAVLQGYLLENLIPDRMAQQILSYLNQFAGKARGLTLFGIIAVVFTAVTLMLTIDKTFNTIWRVKRPRPLVQRVLVYWAAITLGPLVLGAVFSVSSYVTGASKGLFSAWPAWLQSSAELASLALTACTIAGLYRVIPNAQVTWRDAFTGGIFAAVLFEVAKRVFTGYVMSQPTYASVYGAFAVFPLFLVWIFTSWLIILFGAVISAYAPAIRSGALTTPQSAGTAFMDSIGLLRALHSAQVSSINSLSGESLALALHRDGAYINELAARLQQFGWIGEVEIENQRRWAIICDIATTNIKPLAEKLVFDNTARSKDPLAASVLGQGANASLKAWLESTK